MKRLILTVILFLSLVGVAQASYWGDLNQLFTDTFNGADAYSAGTGTSGGTVTVSKHTLTVAGTYNAIFGDAFTGSSFSWILRTKWTYNGSAPAIGWHFDNTTSTDSFSCGVANCQIQMNNSVVATLSALPSYCTASFCWIKIVSNNDVITVSVGQENTDGTISFTTWGSGGSAGVQFSGNTFVFNLPGTSQLQIGGKNDPCVNHISSDYTYDCLGSRDRFMQFSDSFAGATPYTLSGNVAPSDGSFAVSTNGPSFSPYGNITGTAVQDFVWYQRISTQTQDNVHGQEVDYFADNANIGSANHLAIEFGLTSGAFLRIITSAGGVGATLASSVIEPTPPYYLKSVYHNKKLTVYYANVTSTTFPTTWTLLLGPVDLTGNLAGSYFGWVTGGGTTQTIGGGYQYPCDNYFSNNINWDCFSYVPLGIKLKTGLAPNKLTSDSLNDGSKFTTIVGSFSFGSGTMTPAGGIDFGDWTATAGYQNSAMLVRMSGLGAVNVAVGGHQDLVLRDDGAGNNGIALAYGNDQICLEYYSGGSFTGVTSCAPYPQITTTVYYYFYINGTTATGQAYAESSSGNIGDLLATASITDSGVPSTGYEGIQMQNGSLGGPFPVIMYNYGANTVPPIPPKSNIPVAYFNDNASTKNLLAVYPFGGCGTLPTGPINTNVWTYVGTNTSFQCAYYSGTTAYQNRAGVFRIDITGDTFANEEPNIEVITTANASSYVESYINSSSQLCWVSAGVAVGTCSSAIGTSPTNAYDYFFAFQNNVAYAQICQELTVGVPDFNNCVSNSYTTSGFTTDGVAFIGASNTASSVTMKVGGAFPFVSIRDYGDGNVPTTLSAFLRGAGY